MLHITVLFCVEKSLENNLCLEKNNKYQECTQCTQIIKQELDKNENSTTMMMMMVVVLVGGGRSLLRSGLAAPKARVPVNDPSWS